MATKRTGISADLLIHPGETLSDLLNDRGIAPKQFALTLGIPDKQLFSILHGTSPITAEIAHLLEKELDIPASFWLNLQSNYDAELAQLASAHVRQSRQTQYALA